MMKRNLSTYDINYGELINEWIVCKRNRRIATFLLTTVDIAVSLVEGIRLTTYSHRDIHGSRSTRQGAFDFCWCNGQQRAGRASDSDCCFNAALLQVCAINRKCRASTKMTSTRETRVDLNFRNFFIWNVDPQLVDRILHLYQAAVRSLCYTKPLFANEPKGRVWLSNDTQTIRPKNHPVQFWGVFGVDQVVAQLAPVGKSDGECSTVKHGPSKQQMHPITQASTYPKWSDSNSIIAPVDEGAITIGAVYCSSLGSSMNLYLHCLSSASAAARMGFGWP